MSEKTCVIDGCGKPHRARGWCSTHYAQWRRPSVAVDRVSRYEVNDDLCMRRFWSLVALPTSDGCMIWLGPRDRRGYGMFSVRSTNVNAHRLALWLASGPPDDLSLEAAHSCRNRHCVAPAHLRWATHAENMTDRQRGGTQARGETHASAKLTTEQVLEIRRRHRAGGVTCMRLADEYDVKNAQISAIVNGLRWKHLEEPA